MSDVTCKQCGEPCPSREISSPGELDPGPLQTIPKRESWRRKSELFCSALCAWSAARTTAPEKRDGEFFEHVRWVERAIAGKRPMTLIYGREGRTELKAILTIRDAVAMLLEPDPEKRLSTVKIGCMPVMQPRLEALRKKLPPEIGSRILLEVFEPVDKLLGLDPFR